VNILKYNFGEEVEEKIMSQELNHLIPHTLNYSCPWLGYTWNLQEEMMASMMKNKGQSKHRKKERYIPLVEHHQVFAKVLEVEQTL